MSGEVAKMEGASELTNTEVLAKLLSEELKKFHTNIPKPTAFTVVDMAKPIIAEEFGDDVGELWQDLREWFRTNMVAYNGQRAEQIANAVAAKIKDERASKFSEKMLGDLAR